MSSLASILFPIQTNILFSVACVYATFGFARCLLNILLFSRKQFRSISCCTYLLAAAVAMMVNMLLFVVPTIYGYFYTNPLTYSTPFCKIRMYLVQTSSLIYRWSYAAASFDRYALSSPHARLRALANVRTACRALAVMATILTVTTTYVIYAYEVKANYCGIYVNTFWPAFISVMSFVQSLFIPLSIMAVFAFLIRKNLAGRRQRRVALNAQPQAGSKTEETERKRDQQALRMLFAQIVGYFVVTTPWMVYSINTTISYYIQNKSADRIAIENFISYMGAAFAYLFPAVSFYLYTLTSNMFRKELRVMLRSWLWDKCSFSNHLIHPTTTSQSKPTPVRQ